VEPVSQRSGRSEDQPVSGQHGLRRAIRPIEQELRARKIQATPSAGEPQGLDLWHRLPKDAPGLRLDQENLRREVGVGDPGFGLDMNHLASTDHSLERGSHFQDHIPFRPHRTDKGPVLADTLPSTNVSAARYRLLLVCRLPYTSPSCSTWSSPPARMAIA